MFRINQQLSIYLLLIVFICSSYAQQAPYREGEILVRFAKDANNKSLAVTQRNSILASAGAGQIKRTLKSVPDLSLVQLPAGLSVKDAIKTLKGKSGVVHAQPNFIYKALTFPDDTIFNEQWALYNTGQTGGTSGADIDAPKAWDHVTHSNIIVAVIDSGVDYTHPDMAANMWTDANGCYGYDFVNDDNDPMDDNFHGTHCAGIIGAVGNNNEGVTGVCWDVKIMALKFLDSGGGGNTADAIESIDYAVVNGAKILNNSWGGNPHGEPEDTFLKNAIEYANSNGVIFVAAAGNKQWYEPEPRNIDIGKFYPASFDCNNIITVMATNHNDEQAYYSYYGPNSVDLAAPGGEMYYYGDPRGILSTIPGNMYDFYQGTSMAAPHVAGACALVWAASPSLTHLEVKQAIMESVDELDSLDGLCVTGGRLNLYKAVTCTPPYLIKTDNVPDGQEVMPYEPFLNNLLEYTIVYDACGVSDTNVFLTDYLPAEVDYYQSIPQGVNDVNARTVTWQIGNMGPNSSGSYTLKVKVNYTAAPGGMIVNKCELAGDTFGRTAFERTPVDCYRGDILYVDADANTGGNGYSWATAYKNLQDALDAAKSCDCYASIWVAEGIYKPVADTNIPYPYYQDYTFELLGDVGLFGHFGGIGTYETGTMQRNFADANNETILEGRIGQNYYEAVYNVVTAANINNAIVDGFTIRDGFNGSAVFLDDSNAAIANCRIKNNSNYGIDVTHFSYPDIHNCTFINNSSADIRVYDHSWPEVSFCILDGNGTTTFGVQQSNYFVVGVQDSIFKNHTSCEISGSSNGTLTIAGSTFQNSNRALDVSNVTTTVMDCSIAESAYRGLQCSNSDVTIEHTLITDNTQEGLYAESGCNLTLTNSVIRRNGADGIELHDNLDTMITNNWIHNNGLAHLVDYGGAGISFNNQSSVPLVRNNTIYDNWTYGLQSSQYGADPNVRNCIIRGNDSGDFYRQNGSFNTVNYCCLQAAHTGTGNITGDPCFYGADNNDLHIRSESICKNAGDPNGNYGNETDIDGENRVYYGRIDMGADEYYWPKADYNTDQMVDFFDYSIFAGKWLTTDPCISLDADSDVGIYDLALFCEDWLWEAPWGYGWMLRIGGSGFGGEMLKTENILSNDKLMFSDAKNSYAAMPKRIAEKAQKFYTLNAFNAASAKRLQAEAKGQIESCTVEDLVKWIDDLWQSGELKDAMTYEDYLDFREAILKPIEE